jgi:hypothetical protein
VFCGSRGWNNAVEDDEAGFPGDDVRKSLSVRFRKESRAPASASDFLSDNEVDIEAGRLGGGVCVPLCSQQSVFIAAYRDGRDGAPPMTRGFGPVPSIL